MLFKTVKAWHIWFIAAVFYLFEFIHRVAISVMVPELMSSFDISLAAIGSLSACYFYAYAVAQIPVGLILDQYSARLILTISCITLTCASVWFAVTDSFLSAQICRTLIGLGSAFAFVGCLKLATIWFKAKNLGFIIGLTNLMGICGAIIGGKPTADAVDIFGWRNVMLASATIGLLITILLWQIVRDPTDNKQTNTNLYDIKHKIIALAKDKQIWIIAFFGGLMVAPIGTYSELWGVSFLVKHYHLARPEAAQIATLSFIGIAIGGPMIGKFSDMIGKRKFPMLLGTILTAICMSCILIFDQLPLWIIGTLHFSLGFFTSSMLLCFSLSAESSPLELRATTIALVNSVIMIMVALLQTLSGFILDFSNSNFIMAFAPIIVCYLLAMVLYNLIREKKGDKLAKHD